MLRKFAIFWIYHVILITNIRNQRRDKVTIFERFRRCAYWLHVLRTDPNYTAYFLKHVAKFRSSYSIRLYEMLIQWKSVGSTEIEVDELRQLWVLENKYPAMCDLKKRVIEPALRDINEYSNLWVKVGQRKRGRRVHSLQFRFGLKQQEKKKKQLTREYIEKHAKPGESWEDAVSRLKTFAYKSRSGNTS